jgi:hypothetical protein
MFERQPFDVGQFGFAPARVWQRDPGGRRDQKVGKEWIPDHKRGFNVMNTADKFPAFDHRFADLNQFILELVKAYETGGIKSWDDLEKEVNAYFTPQRMKQMESLVPGWQKMASYVRGVTLTHVMGVFLGLFMLPEFQRLAPEQQQFANQNMLS